MAVAKKTANRFQYQAWVPIGAIQQMAATAAKDLNRLFMV